MGGAIKKHKGRRSSFREGSQGRTLQRWYMSRIMCKGKEQADLYLDKRQFWT